jgi:predicted nucleic-acid-binding Zn-ribbon protein
MAHPTCPVCNTNALASNIERRRGLCEACAVHTGLWLEPPSIRPTRPCQRCGNTQFVCSQMRERGRGGIVPFAIAMADAKKDGPGGFVTSSEAAPWAPMGILVAFACRQCGLTELYTLDADKIPIGREYGTHLVDYTPTDGPMR